MAEERLASSPVLAYPIKALEEEYVMKGEQLGKGHFGVIWTCVEKKTGKAYACKTIDKDKMKSAEARLAVRLEVGLAAYLRGHPNVVEFKSVHEDVKSLHMVMELCQGGDLFSLLAAAQRFSEVEASWMIRKILAGVSYCHRKQVVHRDLKLENILLKVRSNGAVEPKLADFGLAAFLEAGQTAAGLVGSPFYVSPEAIRAKECGRPADIWAVGVVLYTMLSGRLPFHGESTDKTLELICIGRPDYERKPWTTISVAAKKLVFQMMAADPALRPTADDLLAHPWIVNASSLNKAASTSSLSSSCSSVPHLLPSSSTSSLPPLPSGSAESLSSSPPRLRSLWDRLVPRPKPSVF